MNINRSSLVVLAIFTAGGVEAQTTDMLGAPHANVEGDLRIESDDGAVDGGSNPTEDADVDGVTIRYFDYLASPLTPGQVQFSVNQPLAQWLWEQNTDGSAKTQMTLGDDHILTLFDGSGNPIIVFDPVAQTVEIDGEPLLLNTGETISLLDGGLATRRIGIGVASPSQTLHVGGHAQIDGSLILSDSSSLATAGALRWTGTAFQGYNGTSWEPLATLTESDPAFTASAASGLTSTQITNWDLAFGWGNHAIAGYLTSEVDGSVINELVTDLSLSNGELSLTDAGGVHTVDLSSYISVGANGNTSWGTGNSVSGVYSTAWGYGNSVNAEYSTAWGYGNDVSGYFSSAWGEGNTVLLDYSTAMGQGNTAADSHSIAAGANSETSGAISFAFGEQLKVDSSHAAAFGRYNIEDSGPDPYTWEGYNALLAVGVGSSNANRVNAFTVMKDGRMVFGLHNTLTSVTYFDEIGQFQGPISVGNYPDPQNFIAEAGAIRWTGADFEGYDGSAWISLTTSGVTQEADPIFAASPASGITAAQITDWEDAAVSAEFATTWLTGSGDPTTEGDDGDLYLNTDSGDLFKKTAGSWGAAIGNLKGQDGDSFFAEVGDDAVYSSGNIQAGGGIKLGGLVGAPSAGAIQWNGSDLFVYNGASWVSLTQSSSDADGDPSNEKISGFTLDGTEITITEGGIVHVLDIASLLYYDGTDELVNNLSLSGTSLMLNEGSGNLKSVDLQPLFSQGLVSSITSSNGNHVLSINDSGEVSFSANASIIGGISISGPTVVNGETSLAGNTVVDGALSVTETVSGQGNLAFQVAEDGEVTITRLKRQGDIYMGEFGTGSDVAPSL